jgi:hypothetical protein
MVGQQVPTSNVHVVIALEDFVVLPSCDLHPSEGELRDLELLLALGNLLNNDHFMQHCSDPRLNSSQLRHAALVVRHCSAPLAPILLDPTWPKLFQSCSTLFTLAGNLSCRGKHIVALFWLADYFMIESLKPQLKRELQKKLNTFEIIVLLYQDAISLNQKEALSAILDILN